MNIFSLFPVVDLDNIILKEIRKIDASDFYNYITNSNVSAYLSDDDTPNSISAAEKELSYWMNLFKYKLSFYWGVFDKKSDKIIGTCGFNSWSKSQKRAEISYDLSYDYWSRGIMTRSVKSISQFAFDIMKVNRIQATVAIDNIASIKLLEKSNFKREGMLRNYGILKNVEKDFYIYSRIKNDI